MKKYKIFIIIFVFGLFCNDVAKAQNTTDTQSMHGKSTLLNKNKKQNTYMDISQDYFKLKNDIQNQFNLQYSLDISLMPQWGLNNAGKTIYQTVYSPNINWNIFSSDTFGKGSLQFAYNVVQYWSKANGDYMSNNLALANPINDYGDNSHSFDQLSYTQTFNEDVFSITLGQYPIYIFDGGTYNSNQQINFINYSLSQNATSTYPTASLGAYVQFNPNSEWSFATGMQDANNIEGSRINFRTFDDGDYTTFGYVSYSPTIKGLGSGQYTFLYYYQPSVSAQVGKTQGWSLNVTQSVSDKIAIFGRFNGVSGDIATIKKSMVFGGVYLNPLNRNSLDQIGLALAYNTINKSVAAPVEGTKVRRQETVLEAYWTFGISNWLQITPDVQFYMNPALDSKEDTATVLSLRATFMF